MPRHPTDDQMMGQDLPLEDFQSVRQPAFLGIHYFFHDRNTGSLLGFCHAHTNTCCSNCRNVDDNQLLSFWIFFIITRFYKNTSNMEKNLDFFSAVHRFCGLEQYFWVFVIGSNWTNFLFDIEELINRHASGTYRVFFRKDHILWDFYKLADHREIGASFRHNSRTIRHGARLELCVHIRHVARNYIDNILLDFMPFRLPMEVADQFIQNFLSRTFFHWFLDIIANPSGVQTIAPENGGV